MERAKISGQDKLSLCERTNEELSTEKAHLEQLLKKTEEQQEGLRVELRTLAKEKAETQEKLSQVRPKPCCFLGGLLAAWLSEAVSVGFCSVFVKETLGSAGVRKAFGSFLLETYWWLAELFCNSLCCPLLLWILLIPLSVLTSFLAFDKLQGDDCVVHESE